MYLKCTRCHIDVYCEQARAICYNCGEVLDREDTEFSYYPRPHHAVIVAREKQDNKYDIFKYTRCLVQSNTHKKIKSKLIKTIKQCDIPKEQMIYVDDSLKTCFNHENTIWVSTDYFEPMKQWSKGLFMELDPTNNTNIHIYTICKH